MCAWVRLCVRLCERACVCMRVLVCVWLALASVMTPPWLFAQEFVPDVGVPIDYLRDKLMAKSVTVPGLPAVLFFLTSSDGESEEVQRLMARGGEILGGLPAVTRAVIMMAFKFLQNRPVSLISMV
jgi:hypothetical protein